jgi:hypothetical protein
MSVLGVEFTSTISELHFQKLCFTFGPRWLLESLFVLDVPLKTLSRCLFNIVQTLLKIATQK